MKSNEAEMRGTGVLAMKQVGSRRETAVVACASAELLAQGARFSEALSHLSPSTFVPKGAYRFATHQEANRHALDCLARGMGLLAIGRR